MARPQLWFEYVGQPGTSNTLSYVPPYNIGTIRFSCDKAFNKFLCRCTKDGDPYGRELGYLVQEYNGERPASTIIEFEINSITAMTQGDGLYRISLYVRDTDGVWNEGEYFLVKGGGYFLVGTDHDKVVVKDGSVEPIESWITFESDVPFTMAQSFTLYGTNATMYYSTDTENWSVWERNSRVACNTNNKLYVRCKGTTKLEGSTLEDNWQCTPTTAQVTVKGKLESLIDYETVASGGHPTMGDNHFRGLFGPSSWLVNAYNLEFSENVTSGCYQGMFYACVNLTQPPKELPALTLVRGCYREMFCGCRSMVNAIETLPATTLAEYCYNSMYYACTSLQTPSKFPNTDITLAGNCCNQMYYNDSALEKVATMQFADYGTGAADTDLQSMYILCGVVVSNTETTECPHEFRIPRSGTATYTRYANTYMFETSVSINKTYYINKEVI